MRKRTLRIFGALFLALPASARADLLAYDTSEYVVERDRPGASATFAARGPWSLARTYQDGRAGAKGYVYTTRAILVQYDVQYRCRMKQDHR